MKLALICLILRFFIGTCRFNWDILVDLEGKSKRKPIEAIVVILNGSFRLMDRGQEAN